jgi:hypothetical protein
MYSVERSVVTFSRLGVLVGSVEGRAKLELNGRVGVNGEGRETLRDGSVALVKFEGLSHIVYSHVSNDIIDNKEALVPCLCQFEILIAGLY